MKTPLLSSLVSIVFMVSLASAECPIGDLNRDCEINFSDFALLAENWLGVEPNLPFGSVVINEVLAHSHDLAWDWIELYNTTGSAIDIGGWYLSDSDALTTKYRIPNGTTIPAYGYVVFYENPHFGVAYGDNVPFALSENGDEVYLSLPRDGSYFVMDDRQFDASETGVSFGRYTTSLGEVKFTAMNSNTDGQLNSYPKVGPIVINEVMYYFSSADPDPIEYIELYNIENYPVNLWVYDPCTSGDLSWRITKGVDYTFPYPTTIPAHGYIVVVKDEGEFSELFDTVPLSIIFGPFAGKLSNEGENVELSMPGELVDPCDLNSRVYIRIDNVSYSDGQHHENFLGLDPWRYMTSANGNGESLHRINPNLYGDDVNNWRSDVAGPWRINR